jgi:uncharacterized protein YjbI with pentapeptide repeats
VVLLAAVTMVAAAPSAGADVVIDGCTIVLNPTAANRTVCPYTDFTNAYLHGYDLTYADLGHDNFTNANLTGTTLVGANLTAAVNLAQLSGTHAADAIFAGDVFPDGACLCGDFTGADLAGASIADPPLGEVTVNGTFNYADLSNATIKPFNLAGTFLSTNLRGSTFNPANFLSGVDFTGADFSGADVEVNGTNLNLTNANFDGVRLQGGLESTTITGSTWSGSDLVPGDRIAQDAGPGGTVVTWPIPLGQQGVFVNGLTSTCDHSSGDTFPLGSTVANCTVTATDTGTTGSATFTVDVVHDVTIDGCLVVWQPTSSHHTSCAGADLSSIDLRQLDLEYADLSGANLTRANLEGTDLEHADLSNANLTLADLGNPAGSGSLAGTDFQYADLTGVNLTRIFGFNANFSHTILAVTDRTYASDGGLGGGRTLGWKAPPGYASVTGLLPAPYGCNPYQGSHFPLGTTSVTCQVRQPNGNDPGFFTFTETVLPVVQPGAGTVTAPSSGTADLQVAVSLNTPAATTVTVPWTTLHVTGSPTIYGAPQAPTSDYTPSSGTVTFLAGQYTAVVHIPVSADSAGSLAEFIVVSFHDPTGALVGGFWGLGFGIIDPS